MQVNGFNDKRVQLATQDSILEYKNSGRIRPLNDTTCRYKFTFLLWSHKSRSWIVTCEVAFILQAWQEAVQRLIVWQPHFQGLSSPHPKGARAWRKEEIKDPGKEVDCSDSSLSLSLKGRETLGPRLTSHLLCVQCGGNLLVGHNVIQSKLVS